MLKSVIKKHPGAKRTALAVLRCFDPLLPTRALAAIPRYLGFAKDWIAFRRQGGKISLLDAYPCLFDKTSTTAIDTHYFHQALWAFRRIQAQRPARHVDVGSDVNFVGLLTTITSVSFIDIRPLQLAIENYDGIAGSILDLPFGNNSVASLSSLHVIEHIGLGRYGDPIDPQGPEKAAAEILRVLQPGGRAYISVPIGRPRVQFNSQRVFGVEGVISLFSPLRLEEFSMVTAPGTFKENTDPAGADIEDQGVGQDYGLGMFVFRKNS